MRRRFPTSAWRDTRGTAAIEFALVSIPFVLTIVGTMYFGMMLFVTGSLQYAVEEAARCYSVKTTVCTNNSNTVAYANSHFWGLGIVTPSFTTSSGTCGSSLVTGTVSFGFYMGTQNLTVPISATACFP